MFPYITVFGMNIYMTGIGIFLSLLVFLIVSAYLIKKYHQDYLTFFYWIPLMLIFTYFFGKYTQFVIDFGLYPHNIDEFVTLISPYGYKFHFIGLALGFIISLIIFFRKIRSNENKRIWIDIMFVSLSCSMIPMGLFLLLGDNFVGKATTGIFGIKSLVSYSSWNKFSSVYPIGIILSFGALISLLYMIYKRRTKKQFGYGCIGFVFLIIFMNISFLLQQYPRYLVIGFGELTFDVKQYLSFLIIMFFLYKFYKRKNYDIQS